MSKVLFPGSFDPPTMGHIDIINRACKVFDTVYIVVANNMEKHSLFTLDEKLGLLNEIFKDNNKVIITSYSGLMANFAKENDIKLMVRGVRAQDDFNYEFELAMNNRNLNKDLDVFFIPTDQKYFLIRSSQVKEYAKYGASISGMVPDVVEKALKEKLKVYK